MGGDQYYPYNNRYGVPNYNIMPQYQGFAQQPNNYAQNAPQQPTNIVGSVNGFDGAKDYLVPPNCTAFLWDNSDQSALYVKSADIAGKPTVLKFNRTAETSKPTINYEEFVKTTDFNALKEEVEKLKMLRPVVSRGDN